jgi:hypothetical protein
LSNLPVLCRGFTEFGEDGRVALLREHVSRPPSGSLPDHQE